MTNEAARKWRETTCVGEHRQAPVENGRAKAATGFVEFGGQRLVGARVPRLDDQPQAAIGMDPPVAAFVGVREGRAQDRCTEAGMTEVGKARGETGLDVA